MNKNIHYVFLFLILVFISSCNSVSQNNDRLNKDDRVVVTMKNDTIYAKEVDNVVSAQLSDILYQIYFIRKRGAEVIIENRIIKKEALKYNITEDQYKEKLIYGKIDEKIRNKYIKLFNFKSHGVPIRNSYTKKFDFNSEEGQELANEYIKEYYYDDYLDSLKKVYEVNFLLKSPQNHMISKGPEGINQYSYNINKVNSKNEIILVTNPNCQECKKYFQFFQDSVQTEFKRSVNISLVILSDHVSNEVKMLEAAKRQDKLLEVYSLLNKEYKGFDNTPKKIMKEVFSHVALDSAKFIRDFSDKKIHEKADLSIKTIIGFGIIKTPTLMVNNKIVQDIFNIKEMRSLLQNAN